MTITHNTHSIVSTHTNMVNRKANSVVQMHTHTLYILIRFSTSSSASSTSVAGLVVFESLRVLVFIL